MAKYEVGDRFEVEVTTVDDSGLGTIYWLNEKIMVNELQLNELEKIEVSLSEPVAPSEPVKRTYTPEDLLERISRANIILGELIKTYVETMQTVNHIPAIDNRLEDLSL